MVIETNLVNENYKTIMPFDEREYYFFISLSISLLKASMSWN